MARDRTPFEKWNSKKIAGLSALLRPKNTHGRIGAAAVQNEAVLFLVYPVG